jgi:hypothetical protein
MLPGPDYIYACPGCGHKIICRSIMSGNTFGGHLWSDGRGIFPMLPEIPELVECPKCKTIFWFKELNDPEIEDFGYSDDTGEDRSEAQVPSQKTYEQALKNKIYKTNEDEIYLRQRLWWAYNDKVRYSEGKNISLLNIRSYRNNLLGLLSLLDMTNDQHQIMAAEINRNLAWFPEAIEILSNITHPDMGDIVKKLIAACKKKNTGVIMLW